MIHGLWSGPFTWMEMFNDLHGFGGIAAKLSILVLRISDGPAAFGKAPPNCDGHFVNSVRLDPQHRDPWRWIRWCWSATAWAG